MKRTLKNIIAAVLAAATLTTAVSISVFAEPDNTDVQPATPTTYTGEEVTPPVSISDEGIQLQNGVDYDLTYENNINVGTATAIVTFKGNYSGTAVKQFEITAKQVSVGEGAESSIVISDIPDQTYTGAAITPEPVITDVGR